MPYMAVRCSSCSMLQVKEVRTSTSSKSKWKCVICNQKQSLRKVYAKSGSSKEIRQFVQKLNLNMGLAAAEDEMVAAMESAEEPSMYPDSTSSSFDHPKHEECTEEAGIFEPAANARGRKDWAGSAQDWSAQEGCTQESMFAQSFQDDKIAAAWYDNSGPPSAHSPRKRSHPLPPRTLQSLSAVKDCSRPGSSTYEDSQGHAATLSRTENLLSKLKRPRHFESGGRTVLHESSGFLSKRDEDLHNMPSVLDGLPNRIGSMQNSVPVAAASKWSKYLD